MRAVKGLVFAHRADRARRGTVGRARCQRWLAGAWIIWAAAFLGIYYARLWHLLGEGAWAWSTIGKGILWTMVPLAIVGVPSIAMLAVARWPFRWISGSASGSKTAALVTVCFVIGGLVLAGIALQVGSGWSILAVATSGLPAFGEAAERGLRGLAGATVLLLAAQVVGAAALGTVRWRFEDRSEAALCAMSIGLGGVAYLLLGLAGMGLYRADMIIVLLAVLLACGGFWVLRLRLRGGLGRIAGPAIRGPSLFRPSSDTPWKVVSGLAVSAAFVSALAPEREYDALWYHLGFPRLWLEHGWLVDLPAEYVSLYPMTWELLFGAGLALGGPVAAKLLHFACLPLIALLVHQMTRRYAPRAQTWLAVAIFVSIPTVLWEASTAYVDLAVTLHVGIALYALLRYGEARARQWLALAAVNLGLALGTKHLALLALILAAVGLAAFLKSRGVDTRRAATTAALLGTMSLLVASPWYARSWLGSGNPVFPKLFAVLGAPLERWDAVSEEGLGRFEARFGRPRTPLNMLALPWDVTVHAARYGGTLGPMFLLLLPALVLLRRRARFTSWLGSFAALYVALWASPMSSFQLRFLLPIAPVLAVLAAESYARLLLPLRSVIGGGSRLALSGVVAVLLVLNLPPNTPLHEVDRAGWDGWLTHVIRRVPIGVVIGRHLEEDYLARAVPSYRAWRHINAHLLAEARILTFSGGDHFYSHRDRIWSDATIARPAVWGAPAGSEGQALKTLRTLGITHVLFDRPLLDSLAPGTLAIAPSTPLGALYELEYEDGHFTLYRIRWEEIPSENRP